MTIGSGIFFSAVFLGFILLFINTKEKWPWGKYFKRLFIGLISLAAIAGAYDYADSYLENRPTQKFQFASISLSDKKEDVLFKLGEPKVKQGDDWFYANHTGNPDIYVSFVGNEIRLIAYLGDCTYCNNIFSLGIDSPHDEVIKRLGKPSHSSVSKDGLERMYTYENYNVFFLMKENKVKNIGIYNKKYGRVGFKNS